MQADAFLFDVLVEPGDTVVVEAPTYDRTLLGLRNRGAEILAIPLEEDGIDVEALAAALEAGARPKLAHIIPNFQNPAGYTLSLDKRRRLLELAAEYDFVLFEDDPYIELRFSGETLPTMLSLDEYEHGRLRVVVLEDGLPGHPRRLPRRAAGADRADRDAGDQHVHLAEHGRPVDRQRVLPLRRARDVDRDGQGRPARARRRAGEALRRDLPDAEFEPPEGGYFMWVTLPEGTDVDALAAAAKDRGVIFVKGTDFLLEGGQNTLRLAFSGVTPNEIDEGISRLADAYKSIAGVAA